MSLSEASKHIGLSKSYISELERGRKEATLAVLEKYSKAFNISMSSLMLFAEHTGDSGLAENTRAYVSDKALKILEWVETISAYKEKDLDE